MNMIYELYITQVLPNKKAVVGFILAAVSVYLTKHGLSLNSDLQTALQTILSGLVAGAGVWLAENHKQ